LFKKENTITMRQFKSEFHAGTGKNIIVLNVYVPSNKRREQMTTEQFQESRRWAVEALKDARRVLMDVTRVPHFYSKPKKKKK
jgi:hypothetical protein